MDKIISNYNIALDCIKEVLVSLEEVKRSLDAAPVAKSNTSPSPEVTTFITSSKEYYTNLT